MTVGFDRTADCQGNHPSLTEFLRILTEHYWLCFDRTTSLTEHLGNLGFDRTVNGEMFCQKNVISRVSCHIWRDSYFVLLTFFVPVCLFSLRCENTVVVVGLGGRHGAGEEEGKP